MNLTNPLLTTATIYAKELDDNASNIDYIYTNNILRYLDAPVDCVFNKIRN